MMTKKTMAILSVFMIVALTAVGFAAWLIVGTIDDDAQGSFVANELKDKYFKVEVEFDTTTDDKNGQIIFGTPTDDGNQDGRWLSYDSTNDPDEHLTATATIKFIPDAGFSKVIGQEKDMAYYLLDSEQSTDTQTVYTYRTVRVKIDIAEIFDENGEQETTNYQWFDWAVKLGYLQYPTAQWLDPATEDAQNKDLAWGSDADVDDEGNPAELTEETDKFKSGCLYLDLTYDMFEIQYEDDSDVATEATAKIQITFNWGTATMTSQTTGEDENAVTTYTYNNPYTFFADKKPEDTLVIDYYLNKVTDEASQAVTYALNATTKDVVETADENEGDTGADSDSVIRYKDLAQRMLDYLRDYLNYTQDTDGSTKTGIQFSIELLEGNTVTETVEIPAEQ